MNFEWVEGFVINVQSKDEEVIISANKEGLLSLAKLFKTLAEEPSIHAHIHLDQYNSLEDNSSELIIEKL